MALEPGRLTRAAIHTEAGEAELRMSAAGNWQLAIRASEEREWRLACSGDLQAGASSLVAPSEHKRYRFGKLLVDTVFLGAGVPIFGPVSPSNKTWYWTGQPVIPHDPEQAKQLLASIGPFLWSLEGAERWVRAHGAGEPEAESYARALGLLARVLSQLKARVDEVANNMR